MMNNAENIQVAKSPAPRFGLISSRVMGFVLEWLLIVLIAYFYSANNLLNFDSTKLQQSGEHNESATLPLLAEIGLLRYGEIPLWNPYMQTGFPLAGDLLSHFWNPVSTIPVLLWGGINGMKVSIFLTFIVAGIGQWLFAYVFGLRRVFRLWSSVLFMISGGLALLWRVGWYELLIGAVWFPWCFAAYWHSMQSQKLSSIFLTSITIFMVISAGGGYYPIYLLVSMAVLMLAALVYAKSSERMSVIRTTILTVICSLALCAVILLPYLDSYRHTMRNVDLDKTQAFSQPIPYGLINYVIYTPEWLNATVLGTGGGWNWFYIGWLPIAALVFAPLAFNQTKRQRWAMAASGILFLILMLWFANRFSPFKQIYDWIPFLYSLRFPNRLLIIAASPLLILSAHALEYSYRRSVAAVGKIKLFYKPAGGAKITNLPVHYAIHLVWIIDLIATSAQVYKVNKAFAFADQALNSKSFTALNWLKTYDPSLYYVNIGGQTIYWDWVTTAYTLEMPMINFQYSRSLKSREEQKAEGSPFIAQPKYQISASDQPAPENAGQLREFDGISIWHIPNALPYAFSVQPSLVKPGSKLNSEQVHAMQVDLHGPNQIIVKGTPGQKGDVLVVLAGDYPGWKLLIDGKPTQVKAQNGYLGATMLPGEHSYLFYFQPAQYIAGAMISLVTLILMCLFVLFPFLRASLQKIRLSQGKPAESHATS